MIYFIRHGQTDWNLQGKLQGRADIPINDTGIRQAEQLREQLRGIVLDRVFCSPLLRARMTCSIVCPSIVPATDDRIIERDFGEYEGAILSREAHSDLWNSEKDQSFLRAESIFEMIDRVYAFLRELLQRYPGENILISSHGGVGMVVHSFFFGAPPEGSYFDYLSDNGVVRTYPN